MRRKTCKNTEKILGFTEIATQLIIIPIYTKREEFFFNYRKKMMKNSFREHTIII